ncbi:T9SS type A sorting domain-containing protein [Terrimonas sp. NA20]|uniref:T9SS type A sorting domain-containing protein n=1 Tax=Terrimonas ginsenosidimutans TaxID=2908004 RepID=A0ABS9KVU0_9BACT|nr:zinc-dependent metalloprotease [Terrimonas ginsenosidimutans]MCG2616459.1 T9SS type A sorting domain-containing protein [Terrimonas ginsenosidimutans]
MKNILPHLLALLLCVQLSTWAQAVPVLNSYPAANSVIFLDFDGHTDETGSWSPFGPVVLGPSGMSDPQIIEAFNRIAEDFRPFNINITTDSTKYWAAPLFQRTRVVLTVSSSWYSNSAGGVSWVGSFTWGTDAPCFVFTALLGYNTKNIAEAASHEAGHTLGLQHQTKYDGSCNKVTDYDPGVGTGEIGWAPIMGVGYYQNFTLWHNGTTIYGCASRQNDLDVITSADNGFGYRPDDHGKTFATATIPAFSANQFDVTGVIDRNTDQDIFKFIMPTNGRLQIDAVPYNVGTGNAGSDLDMQVSLYNEQENLLSVYNPGNLLNSVTDTQLNAGTYFIKVEGKGNLYAPAYASLGSYSMHATIQPNGVGVLPLRKLDLKGIIANSKHLLNWQIDIDEKIIQQVLEISTDGRTFQSLVELTADARNYIYQPASSSAVRYRVNVILENGHRYYSNNVSLQQENNRSWPRVAGNPIQSNAVVISSPGQFDYTLVDANGRTIMTGKLVNGLNTIQAPALLPGIYLVRYSTENAHQTEKIVRQ